MHDGFDALTLNENISERLTLDAEMPFIRYMPQYNDNGHQNTHNTVDNNHGLAKALTITGGIGAVAVIGIKIYNNHKEKPSVNTLHLKDPNDIWWDIYDYTQH